MRYWLAGNEGWMDRYEQVAGELDAIWARSEVEGADVEEVMDEYEAALEDAGL